MAITLKQAKNLKIGIILYDQTGKNADGTPMRWVVNGKVKTWKKDSSKVRVPLRRGLRDYAYLDETKLEYVKL